MHGKPSQAAPHFLSRPLENFATLQSRYERMSLPERAAAILADSAPVWGEAEKILAFLTKRKELKAIFEHMRKNHALTAKMRASEAKTTLMDAKINFIEHTQHKIHAWQKGMERLSQGEAVVKHYGEEFVPENEPLALAINRNLGIGCYFSILHLALAELAEKDKKNAREYQSCMARIRRCATVISDYEDASGIKSLIH